MSSKYEKFEDVDTGSIDHDLYPVNQTTLSSQSDLTDTVEIIINPLSSSTVSQPTASNSVASNHSDWKVTTNGDVEHKVHSLSSPARSSELPIKSSQSNYETYQEYPEDEEQLSPLQKRLRHRLEHVVFRVLSLLLILIDCTILIAQLANPFLTDSEQKLFDTISAMFAVYFCIEITLRIFARG